MLNALRHLRSGQAALDIEVAARRAQRLAASEVGDCDRFRNSQAVSKVLNALRYLRLK